MSHPRPVHAGRITKVVIETHDSVSGRLDCQGFAIAALKERGSLHFTAHQIEGTARVIHMWAVGSREPYASFRPDLKRPARALEFVPIYLSLRCVLRGISAVANSAHKCGFRLA